MENDVWWYYMLELSFYWSLSFSQFFDVKRKDFWEMFLHHNTTICLIMFSWTAHFTRIGTLVMILHDCADPLLELAKLFRYAGYRKTCDAVFVLFSLIWVMTRYILVHVYPQYYLNTQVHAVSNMDPLLHTLWCCRLHRVFCTLLHLQQSPGHPPTSSHSLDILPIQGQYSHQRLSNMHYQSLQAIHKALTKGGVDDQRSDSEPSEDENENELKKEN